MLTSEPIHQPAQVLVVDDDPIFCELILSDLTIRGLKVVVAGNLTDAREALSRHKFDIIMLDNYLPDGSGTSLLPMIKLLDPSPYAIMISTDDKIQTVSESFASGIHDYIIKPVSVDLLWEKIRNLLSFKRANVELAKKNHLLQKLIEEKDQEENLAQHVYENMAGAKFDMPNFTQVKTIPMSSFSGDTIISLSNPTGKTQLVLADAMGHGLAAAICILPIVSTAKAMAFKGKSLDEIFHEINRKLYYEIPDDRFVALLGIEICPYTNTIGIINAGLPDVLCATTDHALTRYKSRAVPLGIMAPQDFDIEIEEIPLETLGQLAIYTDGLTEQTNHADEAFSMDRLISLAEEYCASNQSLINLMDQCLEFAGNKPAEDDMTLCVIDGNNLRQQLQLRRDEPSVNFGELDYCFTIRGQAIATMDILNQAMHIMQNAELPRDLCQKAFTVLAELVNNAVDHGILHLDSSLKNDVEGFATYLGLREERIRNLQTSDELIIQLYANSTTFINISVEDSGAGFSLPDNSSEQRGLSGRGLKLLDAMCQTVKRNTKGNRTSVTISRN